MQRDRAAHATIAWLLSVHAKQTHLMARQEEAWGCQRMPAHASACQTNPPARQVGEVWGGRAGAG